MRLACCCLSALLVGTLAYADDRAAIEKALAHPVVAPDETLKELQDYVDAKIPRMPRIETAAQWKEIERDLRTRMLNEVIFRGEAANWRDAKSKIEWLDTVPGTRGYRLRKLRFEAVPGLWIPALLYEPDKLDGKVPVGLAVNGHDPSGKASPYKQVRCINMAKRGMIVLNLEWFNMGQLRGKEFAHGALNQIDLCGTSGLAPFYLAMSRGLDILLAHEHADPQRVAVSGLSGGGWQTIFISALDTRVTLSNPVAGYSSNRTRLQHIKDLGDSEQTPCDMSTIADYTHLTALLAPRPILLTYNLKDDCCFESGYAMPPLESAARPVFQLLGADKALRTHVNDNPGTHNYEKDNRQAYYRMLGDFFFKDDPRFSAEEIACQDEVRKNDELNVPLPAGNATFNSLAKDLAEHLPRNSELPRNLAAAEKWRTVQHQKLRELLRVKDFSAEAAKQLAGAGQSATNWRLKVNDRWSVPVVELVRGEPKATTILIGDAGRARLAEQAGKLLDAGHRVLAVDLFFFGEAAVQRTSLNALLHATVGDRPLGLQAGQLAAVARWAAKEYSTESIGVAAVGPRNSLIALAAAGLEGKAIGALKLHGSLGSLKELIEQNKPVESWPEMFCFGLLESFDVRVLTALAVPRPVTFVQPSERVKKELKGLKEWYGLHGQGFDPLADK
jgi:Acetyl xylan esterase (AXE1)